MHIPTWALPLAAQYNGEHRTKRTNSATICLPHELQAVVPDCAVSCLQSFVQQTYYATDCPSTADLSYLCTTPTYSGLTLGEGSLQCVISSCIGADIETQSGYTICDNIPNALPNMAGTITATISPLTSLSSDAGLWTPSSTGQGATATTPGGNPTSIASEIPASSVVDTAAPTTPSAVPDPPVGTPLPSSSIQATVSASLGVSSPVPDAQGSSAAPVASDTPIVPTTTRTATLSSVTSPINSATAAAAAEKANAEDVGLSTSAIAGIATASVVVVALLLGYLAYWFFIKRREKQKYRSQKLTGFFLPVTDDGSAGSGPPAVAGIPASIPAASLTKRYFSGETVQEQRKSFWRESFYPPSGEIGVAVAASMGVSPEHSSQNTTASNAPPNRVLWPAAMVGATRLSHKENDSWSRASSFDENSEAQDQELLALANARSRSSSRSVSWKGVRKPAPLRLSKITPRAGSPPSGKIPLTPVYDNGNITVRQVLESSVSPPMPERQPGKALNFSRGPVPVERTVQASPQPLIAHARRQNPVGRFPVRPIVPERKESETTDKSFSIHTDFEEDSTPEMEEDKRLAMPSVPAKSTTKRTPLRELQWPQVPPSSAESRSVRKVASPRAAMTIRQVNPEQNTIAPQRTPSKRAQMIKEGKNFIRTNTSSTDVISEDSKESPVFPMPPNSLQTRISNQGELVRRISDAYKAAARPTTKEDFQNSHVLIENPYYRPEIKHPDQRPQGPRQMQRLGTGRPLAYKIMPQPQMQQQAQAYLPRPRAPAARTDVSQAKITPVTSAAGDWYFRVSGIGR